MPSAIFTKVKTLASSAPASPLELWPEGERVDTEALPPAIDRAKLQAAIEAAFAEPHPDHPRRTRALVVVHDGRIVAERYAPGFGASTPLLGWSMSKMAVNALTGLLVQDGCLHLADKALLPEWTHLEDPRAAITFDQLLRMTSGLAFKEDYADHASDIIQMLYVEGDQAGFAAAKPLAHPPGSYWHYSGGTSNIIARVMRAPALPIHETTSASPARGCSRPWACRVQCWSRTRPAHLWVRHFSMPRRATGRG